MTTYNYTITVDDSEMIALQAALNHYLEHCEGKNEAPYIAHRLSLKAVIGKLHSRPEMTSTSSFCYQGKPI